MPFLCPRCGKNALDITVSLELPADDAWDENTFQLAACENCGLRAAAMYQESRRGSLQDEAWLHTGTVLDEATYIDLERCLSSCPAPNDRRCPCPMHQTFDADAVFQANPSPFPMVKSSQGDSDCQ